MKSFYNVVLTEAVSWLGIQEQPGNMGWKEDDVLNNTRFKNLMFQIGFKLTHAWCAYFCELCWTAPTYSGKSKYHNHIVKLFSGSVVVTYRNFSNDVSGLFTVDKEPVPGCIAFWQTFKDGVGQGTGHMAIVETVEEKESFGCVEGNTNAEGGREGKEVARMSGSYRHNLTTSFKVNNGLRLLGFAKIAEISQN